MGHTNNFSRDNIFNFYALNNANLNVSISVDEKNKSDPSQHVSPENWIEHFKSLLNMVYTNNFSRDNIFNFYA